MYVPIPKKTFLLTGMIFLGLFSTAFLVNSFSGNLTSPEAEIKFSEDDVKTAEENAASNGFPLPGFYDEDYEYKEASLSVDEVLAIAEALDEVQEFKADHENVSVWPWYDGYDYWYVDYSVDYWNEYYIEGSDPVVGKTGNANEPITDYSFYPEWNYLTVIIQDSTGVVSDILQPVEPILTEEEVYDIAVNSEEGVAFLEEYPEADIYISYIFSTT